jgi:hypothetical protein
MTTMRKLQRRRSAVRELLEKLVTPPLCEDAPPASGGLLSMPRPGLAHGSRTRDARRARGHYQTRWRRGEWSVNNAG